MGRNAKKNANQHNAKHENGIVAPGKRVTKQKSNNHLTNGSSDGATPTGINKDVNHSVPAVPLISQTSASSQDASDSTPGDKAKPVPISGITSHQCHNESASEELEESDNIARKTIGRQQHVQHRSIDVTTAKQSTMHDGGLVHLALTVLRSSPMTDTMAILVILLSLPPVVLHLTNAIFALITFVPPSGSFTTLPSLSDITSSFSPGAPSLVVLFLIDILAIAFWSMLPWAHLQTVLLDCAQATVATHLGGGYAFTPGSTDNLLLVIVFVFATHLGNVRKTTLKWLHRTSLSRFLPLIESFETPAMERPDVPHPNRTWFDTLNTFVALHILFQGLTRVIRRALNEPKESPFGYKTVDPEANTNSTIIEGSDSATPSSPSFIKSKLSLQNLKEAREKISSSKRRRKQANYVRSQQPLWAAIAATKAKILREYEQGQATKDAMGVRSADVQDLGNAPFRQDDNKIWITTISSEKIFFETGSIMPSMRTDHSSVDSEAGVDRSSPFTIRVNGAQWASLKVLPIGSEDLDGRSRWVGEIYGLSPANTYKVSWTGAENGIELHYDIIVTAPSPAAEQIISSHVIPVQALRPASPASPLATVKTSIATFEGSINDLNASQKRIRKDGKAIKTRLEKEIEGLNEKSVRISTTIRNVAQKQTQLDNSIKQIEDAIVSVAEQIDNQGSIPEENVKEWQSQKTEWESVRNEMSRIQEDVQRTKEDNHTTLTAAQTKELSERQKRDRAQTRVKKLTTDYANLQNSGRSLDHNRVNSAYANRAAELDQKEAQAQLQYDSLRNSNHELFRETQAIKNEVDHLEHIANQNDAFFANQSQARFAQDSRPITPEGDLPGTNPQVPGSNQSVSFSRPHIFSTPEPGHAIPATGSVKGFTNGFATHRHNSISTRHRSQSAISGNNLHAEYEYEDDEDEDPIPLMHKRRTGIAGVREGSDGRSSGSGSPHVSAGPIAPPAIGFERRTSPSQIES